jgi:hypothetical protein
MISGPMRSFAALVLVLLAGGSAAALAAGTNDDAKSFGQEKRIAAVEIANIDTNFLQCDASCVLASYAIVANYFTRIPVTDYFEGYCHHFGIDYTNAEDAERKYSHHFDAEWKKRKCMGYEVILDLHANATERCFVEARRLFNPQFYLESGKHLDEIRQVLKTREALLNITYKVMNDAHSVTVFYDGLRFLERDTNLNGIYPVVGKADTNNLVDCVLYVRR